MDRHYVGLHEGFNNSEFDSDFDDDATDLDRHEAIECGGGQGGLVNAGFVNNGSSGDLQRARVKATANPYEELSTKEDLPTFLTFLQAHSQAVSHTDNPTAVT